MLLHACCRAVLETGGSDAVATVVVRSVAVALGSAATPGSVKRTTDQCRVTATLAASGDTLCVCESPCARALVITHPSRVMVSAWQPQQRWLAPGAVSRRRLPRTHRCHAPATPRGWRQAQAQGRVRAVLGSAGGQQPRRRRRAVVLAGADAHPAQRVRAGGASGNRRAVTRARETGAGAAFASTSVADADGGYAPLLLALPVTVGRTS